MDSIIYKSKVWRFAVSVLFLVSVFFLPSWGTLVLGIILSFFTLHFPELVVAGIILDSLFSPLSKLPVFTFSVLTFFVYIGLIYLKKSLIFSRA